MSSLKPTEYNAGQPLERYSAERRRRGIAGEAGGYAAGAAGAATAGSAIGNAKIAGTRVGQHSLTQLERRLNASGNPGAQQVGQLKRIGLAAAKHPRRATAGIAASAAVGTGLTAMARMRSNEEAGISQGIGRIKAGESYRNTQARTLSKGLLRMGLMASDANLADPRIKRTWDLANTHKKKIAGGLVATGATGTAVGSARGTRHRTVQATQLRGVSKKAVISPKIRDIANWSAAIGGGSALGAAATQHTTGNKKKSGAAVAGGLAAQGAYQGSAYGAKQYIRARTGAGLSNGKVNATRRGERKDSLLRADHVDIAERDKRKAVKVAHIKANTTAGKTNWKEVHRTFPKALPYHRTERLLAHTHGGKTGMVAGTAATIGGASLAANAVGNRQRVTKGLYQRESKPSILRVAEFGAGAGLTAWGLGRSRMLGAALGRGVKAATTRGDTRAIYALQQAQVLQGVLWRGTTPGERQVRRIRALNTAINAVPNSIRPEVATAAGLLLTSHSRPVNRTSYRPIGTNVQLRRVY